MCIVLAGGLRPSPVAAVAGLPVLDLMLTPSRSALDLWCARFQELDTHAGLSVRVVYDASTPAPAAPAAAGTLDVRVEREPRPYRGPAGIVRDLVTDVPAAAHVLVVEGGRYLASSLANLVSRHHARGGDVTVVCNADRSPAGVYLVRRAALDLVTANGFMDLKEQWLPRVVQAGLGVWVHDLVQGEAYPLWSREQFLRASRAAMSSPRDIGPYVVTQGTPEASRVDAQWCCVAAGAEVADGAAIHESIVMRGAAVGVGAVVARSIVCPGAVIQPGARVVDAVVGRAGVRSDPEALLLRRRKAA